MTTAQELNFWGLAAQLFLVFNAIGQVPLFVAMLTNYPAKKQRKIILRELIISLIVILLFAFFGKEILLVLNVDKSIISISGGLLLVLIALGLIFPKNSDEEIDPKHEPIVIPLAIPGLAGPGTMTAVMVLAAERGSIFTSLAFLAAWVPSLILIFLSSYIKNFLGDKGILAVQKLGGMIISLIGFNMLTKGIIDLVKISFKISGT